MLISEQPLKDRWTEFRAENPKTRIRDAARQLAVTEAELVATGVGETATRLEGDFREMLKAVPTLGYVMALTRNDALVHERRGTYQKVSFNQHVGLVLGPDIDLRLFMGSWKFGFAVSEKDRHSLQFFDSHGEAVHKIYLTERSDKTAYDRLVQRFKAANPQAELEIAPAPEAAPDQPDEAIDVPAFQQDWLAMKDTHDFFGLLKRHGVGRQQGLRLAPDGHARLLSMDILKQILATSAERGVPIMVFVGNPGCIQIHSGPVKKRVQMGPWHNVLDPEFNLHLNETRVDQVWLTKKPTTDGIVTGVELFDRDGQNLGLVFGERKPGRPELESWREIIREVAEEA